MSQSLNTILTNRLPSIFTEKGVETLNEAGTTVRLKAISFFGDPEGDVMEEAFSGGVLEFILEYCRDNSLPPAISWCPTVTETSDGDGLVITCEVSTHEVTDSEVTDVIKEKQAKQIAKAEETKE